MGGLLEQIIIVVGLWLIVTLAIAALLVASQSAKYEAPEPGHGLNFPASEQEYSNLPDLSRKTPHGQSPIPFRRYAAPSPDRPVLMLIHGSGWHSMQFHQLARALADQDLAEVIVPDMRGHGRSPERRGDVDFIGQMEEDVARLIDLVAGDRKVILGGHSSGGGFVIRFAGGAHGDKADGFILMAPFLHHSAPTTRANSGGWARPAIRRLIGLTILNRFGITVFNALPVISFAMPREVVDGPLGKTATLVYSYRLNVGFAPRARYKADLAKLTKPFVLLAGDADEAFIARKYEPLISANTRHGTYHVLKGVGHLDLVTSDATRSILSDWLKTRENITT